MALVSRFSGKTIDTGLVPNKSDYSKAKLAAQQSRGEKPYAKALTKRERRIDAIGRDAYDSGVRSRYAARTGQKTAAPERKLPEVSRLELNRMVGASPLPTATPAEAASTKASFDALTKEVEELRKRYAGATSAFNPLAVFGGGLAETPETKRLGEELTQKEAQLIELENRLRYQERQAYPNGENDSRLGNIFKGAAKTYAAGFANTAGDIAAMSNNVHNREQLIEQEQRDIENYTRLMDEAKAAGMDDSVIENYAMLIAEAEKRLKNFEAMPTEGAEAVERQSQKFYAFADRQASEGAVKIETAKKDLGSFGKFAVDVGVGAGQLAADMGLAALTGGSTVLPLALRSYGGASQQARLEGATFEEAALYGASTALVEALTEKLFSANILSKKAFGAGTLDDLTSKITDAVTGLGKTEAGRAVLNRTATMLTSAAGEGFEEMIASAVSPLIERATYADSINYDFGAILRDGLVGAAIGGLTGISGTTAAPQNDVTAQDGARPEFNRAGEAAQALPTVGSAQTQNAAQGVQEAQEHTPEEVKTMREYASAIDSGVVAFVNKVRSMVNRDASRKAKISIGTVSDANAQRIAEKTGLNVAGYTHIMNGGAVEHIDNRHGVNGKADHSMQDVNDIARMGYALENFDSVDFLYDKDGNVKTSSEWRNSDNTPAPLVRMVKKIDGTYYVVEAAPDSKAKVLAVVSAYIQKSDGGKGPVLNMAQSAPQVTSEVPQVAQAPATDIVTQDADAVNTENGLPMGVGAASAGIGGDYARLQAQTGKKAFQKPGENPRTDAVIEVPKRDFDGRNISLLGRTVMEGTALPLQNVANIEQLIADGKLSYATITDAEAKATAEATLRDKGWTRALIDWTADIRAGKVSKDLTTLGFVMFNNAINAGEVETALDILVDLRTAVTSGAQATQAARIFKQLAPEYQLYGIARSIDNMQREINEKYGDKAPDLEINEQYAKEYMEAQTDKERDEAKRKIYKDIGRQLPSSWRMRLEALRYLSMLLNPVTHIRNMLGNVGTLGLGSVADAISGTIQLALPKEQRTRSVTTGATQNQREVIKWSFKDYSNAQEQILANGKYDDAESIIRENRVAFKWNSEFGKGENASVGAKVLRGAADAPMLALRGLEWANNKMLNDVEDGLFARLAYGRALSQYLIAQGVTAEQLNGGTVSTELLDKARAFATEQAKFDTFRDKNILSDAMVRMGGSSKFTKAIKKAVLPFVRTPANVLVRGAADYSPVGVLRGAGNLLGKVRKGEMAAGEAIDKMCRGLVGTGAMLLGAFLANSGMLVAGEEDDEKAKNDLTGWQGYSLVIGDKYYSIEWATPAALPLFVGAEIFNARSKWGWDFEKIADALTGITEPLFEMSMLSGVNDVFTSISSDMRDANFLYALLTSAATNYLSSLAPTLAGRIENMSEDERSYTYIDPESKIPTNIQYMLGELGEKIPGWDFQQQPYVNALGEREPVDEDPWKRILQNFISPGYASEYSTSDVKDELIRMAEETEGTDYEVKVPERPAKYFSNNGERYNMTAEEYTRFTETRGKAINELMQAEVSSEEYAKMSIEDKAEVISGIIDLATERAKQELIEARGGEYDPSKEFERVYEAAQAGIDLDTYYEAKRKADEIENAPGSANSRTQDYYYWVDKNPDLNTAQKNVMRNMFTFGTYIPGDAEKYTELKSALGADKANAVYNAVSMLKPAAGTTSVSFAQRAAAISGVGSLSDKEKLDALRSYAKGNEGTYEKYRAGMDAGASYREMLGFFDALDKICVRDGKAKAKKDGTEYRKAGVSQDRIREALDDVGLSYTECVAIWDTYDYLSSY